LFSGEEHVGSIDLLFRTDCEIMMPTTPALDQLVKTAESAQPVCEGTLRFSLARGYEKTLVAVRLHRPDLFEANGSSEDASSVSDNAAGATGQMDEPRFRSHYQTLIRGALAELAKYYSDYFMVSSSVAEKQAEQAVNAVISGAYDLCETG
jgi:hypothetical protein